MNDLRSPLLPGTPAPDFSLPQSSHGSLALADLLGHPAVLVFYPGDWEPVSHQQLALYQQHLPELLRFDASLVGISVDSVWSHRAFGRALGLTFPLLSDSHPLGAVSRKFGVYRDDEGRSGRVVVVLDSEGLVSGHRVFPTNLNPGIDGILTILERMHEGVESMRQRTRTIGFIGLGAMGSRMAGRLLAAGFSLGVFDRNPDRARPLVAQGALAFASPGALAQQSDLVLTSLADDAAIEEVILAADGVIEWAQAGTTLIDLSSVAPETIRRVAAAARARGVTMLDAAVSGSTPQAEEGSLVVFVGGDREVYERSRPILDIIGRSVFHLGPSGAGATMKLVVNTMLGVGIQALAEAIALGERAGLQRDLLLDVLGQTAVLTPGQKTKLENARREEYPVTFALRLMWKDFGNILRLAEASEVSMPATAAAHQAFAIAQARRREEDFSAIIQTMRELAAIAAPRAPGRLE